MMQDAWFTRGYAILSAAMSTTVFSSKRRNGQRWKDRHSPQVADHNGREGVPRESDTKPVNGFRSGLDLLVQTASDDDSLEPEDD